VKTGIAPVISGYLLKEGYRGRFQSFGVKYYGASGETEEAYTIEGLDIDTMNKKIMNLLI